MLGSFLVAIYLVGSPTLSFNYEAVDGSQNRFSHELEAKFQMRYLPTQQAFLSYQRLSRSFASASTLYDQIFTVGHISEFTLPLYIIASGSYSPSPDFSAKWAGFLDPHFSFFDRLDFGLGLEIKKYSQETSLLLKPSLYFDFIDRLAFFARSDFLVKPQRLFSFEAGLKVSLHPRFQIRAAGGGGKTYEGQGLSDKFKQMNFGLRWAVVGPLSLFANSQIYRGDLRDENRLGGGFECSF